MKQSDVLSNPANVLTQDEREFFFDQGYAVKKEAISRDWIVKLKAAVDRLTEKSRELSKSDGIFDLEPGHTAEEPRLRRIAFLEEIDEVFWDFARNSNLPDMAADLFGPDVRFREAMLNVKWKGGGQEVKWHQDIPFYPMTNFSVAQFLVCLDDVGSEQGPLLVVPESHKGPLYDHYDDEDNWLGFITDERLEDAGLDRAVELKGPAGTVTVHHCRALHASRANLSNKSRPVLIIGYAAADNRPYVAPAYKSKFYDTSVRGGDARNVHLVGGDLRLPPDWSGGYSSIFDHQEKVEDGSLM
tara:strand:- start:81 stop:980 length:900 start_codon:yes stop_codon:yes gene_type:complete